MTDSLTDDAEDAGPGPGVLELETWAALAVAALASLGGAVVLYSGLEVLTRGVQRVDLGRLPFPSDERAQTDARTTAKQAAGIVSSVGLVGLVKQYGVGGVLYQLFLSIIDAIQGVGGTFLAPLSAFSDGLARVVAAVFPARIINEAADFTAFSITQGRWNFFGPLTFAVGIAAVLLGLGLFVLVARRINFSPLDILYGNRR